MSSFGLWLSPLFLEVSETSFCWFVKQKIMRSFCRYFFLCIAATGVAISAHESDQEHEHCDENGVECELQEDIVRGWRLVTPNSSPTPYTGGSAPTNSSSSNCEGSGCINYEESYAQHTRDPDLKGQPCVTSNGVPGFYTGYPRAGYFCSPDADGDSILDRFDDCVYDATNSDVNCLDDLPNCNELVYAAYTAAGGGISIVGAIIGGALIGKVVIVSGGAVLVVGGVYCGIAYLEG